MAKFKVFHRGKWLVICREEGRDALLFVFAYNEIWSALLQKNLFPLYLGLILSYYFVVFGSLSLLRSMPPR